MAIKIVFPTPESVPHSGGQRLLEIEADALDDLKGLSSRVDDGVRTFYAATGSMARAKDGSAVYEYSPAGEWVPQGSGDNSGPSEVVILPETVLTYSEEEGTYVGNAQSLPEEGKKYVVTYNGTAYDCACWMWEIDPGDFAPAFGNSSLVGVEGGNADAPFLIMLGEDEAGGLRCVFTLTDDTTPESVTLSIVEKAETASAGGGGLVFNVAMGSDGTFTADTTYAEVKAALDAGRHVLAKLENASYVYYGWITAEFTEDGLDVIVFKFSALGVEQCVGFASNDTIQMMTNT